MSYVPNLVFASYPLRVFGNVRFPPFADIRPASAFSLLKTFRDNPQCAAKIRTQSFAYVDFDDQTFTCSAR